MWNENRKLKKGGLIMIARTGEELLELCEKHNISLNEYAIRCFV